MPDEPKPPLFSWSWAGGLGLIAIGIVLMAILTGFGTDAYGWLKEKWNGPGPELVKIDFQIGNGCPLGRLLDIRDRTFEDKNTRLSNGAEKLVICDDEALSAPRNDLPTALATKYTGCLRYQQHGGGLILLRKSAAVCGTPDGKTFVCDGPNGRKKPGLDPTGENAPVSACLPDLLQRFGFS